MKEVLGKKGKLEQAQVQSQDLSKTVNRFYEDEPWEQETNRYCTDLKKSEQSGIETNKKLKIKTYSMKINRSKGAVLRR